MTNEDDPRDNYPIFSPENSIKIVALVLILLTDTVLPALRAKLAPHCTVSTEFLNYILQPARN